MNAVVAGRPLRRALARGAVALAVCAGGAGAASATKGAATNLRFDKVFSTQGEPPALHFQATYAAAGAPHRLEVWRDGDRRLVRRTDAAIETHVARKPGDADYQMVVLDLRRKIETRVTRDDLYRIGHFTDWFDLAHGLRHPKGDYRLTTLPRTAEPTLPTAGPCRWYLLEQGAQRTRICWSEAYRLPIAMLGQGEEPLWRIDALSRTPAPAEVFEVRDFGYVRNDASRDISGD